MGGAGAGVALVSIPGINTGKPDDSEAFRPITYLDTQAGKRALSMAGATDIDSAENVEWLAGPTAVDELVEFSPMSDAYVGQFLGESAEIQSFGGVLSGKNGPWAVIANVVSVPMEPKVKVVGLDSTPLNSATLFETEQSDRVFPPARVQTSRGFTWVAGGGEIRASEPSRNVLECGERIPPTITEDTVLQEGCTYTIPDTGSGSSPRVRNGATLTIEPGVEIEVDSSQKINVADDGTLTARGTEEQPIRIYGSTEQPGHWKGIEIHSDDPANELSHVTVEHVGGHGWNAAIKLLRTDPKQVSIRNCTIRESHTAGMQVDTNTTLADFRNNRIEDCQGPPMILHPHVLTSLTGTTTFANNGESYVLVNSEIIGNTDHAAKTAGTWPAMDVPYEFKSRASIAAQIDIEEGATLQFRGDNRPRLSVDGDGRLVADASDGEPVTFKGVEDSPGTWRGIFLNTRADNLLRNVVVSDGGVGYRGASANVSVGVDGAGGLTLEDSTISDSAGWGVKVTAESTLSAENNTYENNAVGAIQRQDE